MKAITNASVHLIERYMPDAFLFAIILTFVVFVATMLVVGVGPITVIAYWGNTSGFWNLLAFSMQMALIVVLGSALANAPICTKLLNSIAGLAKTPKQGVMVTIIAGGICMWLNWGFGLIAGALLAKAVARKLPTTDYRVLVAAAYAPICMWHAGLSGSIPLTLTTPGAAYGMGYTAGGEDIVVSTGETIFFPLTLITIVVVIAALVVMMLMALPDEEHSVCIDPALLEEKPYVLPEKKVPADAIEQSKIIWALLCIMGWVYIIYYFYNIVANGGDVLAGLTLNILNFIFLFLGILAHGNLRSYVDAIGAAASSAAGVILQFPFYAGIMGMMVGHPDGVDSLAAVLSHIFVSISNEVTFPLFTFISAGIVNFFVPSGGGQWAVQGPIMMPAASDMGITAARCGMAIAWGDCWTNLIQPFWALPVLAVAGLSARDIMGYLVPSLIVVGIIVAISFVIWAYI
jgi:short-chain fatty acids transporter